MLPGLNGTSALFEPLLPYLDDRLEVDCLALPDSGPQDHESLARRLAPRLRAIEAPFVLLGESFSGPLAYRLAQDRPRGLRGVIFAAAFLGCPHPLLSLLPLRLLPLPQRLLTLPSLLKLFCLGSQADPALIERLRQEIQAIPTALLRARLLGLSQPQVPLQPLELPALHLLPLQDRLVMPRASARLEQHCRQLQQVAIAGPHFLLQRQPQACAQAIERFIADLPR